MATERESEERLRVALVAADLGTWDLNLTTDIAAVRSLRHDQIFGYEHHQAEWGQEIAMRHVLPEDRPLFQEAFARAMKTGVLSFQVRVRWPDGSIHWVAPLGRTYYDSEGRPVRIAGVVADVTDRNEAEALRQSEERFRLMANAVPQIVWITDSAGRVEFFNQQWSTYTGLTYNPKTAAEMAAAVVHSDDVAITMERFERAQNSGAAFSVEHRIRSASGDYRWFLVRAEPYRDPASGQISRWFGASVDIHDRKLAEEALRLQTARHAFQLALADRIRPLADPDEVIAVASELPGTHLGVARVVYATAEESGETISINRDWTDGAVTSMAEVVLRLNDFGPLMAGAVQTAEVIVVDDVANDERSAAYPNAYAENGIRSFVAIPLMKNGRLRAISSVHDSRPHCWTEHEVALAYDMVDRTWTAAQQADEAKKRRQAEKKLHETAVYLQFILESAQIGTAVLDLSTGANTRSLQHDRCFGYTGPVAEWSFDIFIKHVHPDDRQHVNHQFQLAVADSEDWHVEFRTVWPDQSVHWVALHASIYSEDGKPSLMIGIVIDTTARKQAEENLRIADRRKDEFLAMLAHELRNPLAPIGTAADLLQISEIDEKRVRQTSQIISRQVRHMTGLVDDLLDVSRVTRGQVELDNSPLDIRHIVTDSVEQVTPLIRARRHHLALHLPPDTTMVMGDRKRLIQVIGNILNNAAKYTNEGGNIMLKVDMHPAHVLIEVSDDGIGMAPELVSRVFDLFVQAERTSDRSSGGLGLGLALVKNLVELHHGKVICESSGVGKGSKFTISLPRLIVQDQREPIPFFNDTVPKQTRSMRVMVVDDNIDAALVLSMLLEISGYEVSVEHGSRSALERARTEALQVCLIDIGLPDIDGNELARQLRTLPETAKSVLIAVTGYGQEKDREQSLVAGFDHHFVKPVDTKLLVTLLASISPDDVIVA